MARRGSGNGLTIWKKQKPLNNYLKYSYNGDMFVVSRHTEVKV
jgi:hypothetical protein